MTGPAVRARLLVISLMGALSACEREAPPSQSDAAEVSAEVRVVDFDSYLELEVGDPPRVVWAILERDIGVHDSVRVQNVTVADSSVIAVVSGAIVGRRAGRSNFYIDVEGARHRGHAYVAERVARDTVSLAPGEVRAWDLPRGQYDIAVRPLIRGEGPSPLELVADITCATDGRDSELIHCLVRTPTRFVLRHNAAVGGNRRAQAFMSITRVP